MNAQKLRDTLDPWLERYHQKDFIPDDPVSIPHRFTVKQDIEIAAFFAAILAWGQRITIIQNCSKLIELMDNAPYDFIKNHTEPDRKRFTNFVHRTFQAGDLLYFIEFLQHHYSANESIESLVSNGIKDADTDVRNGLIHFHNQFFSLPHLPRTKKHVSTPIRNSACKRMNLFMRWMVRYDETGVDFGLWKSVRTDQLICPLDVHVHKAALELGITRRNQSDWTTAVEITNVLKTICAEDPVKYDFALFGYSQSAGFNIASKRHKK